MIERKAGAAKPVRPLSLARAADLPARLGWQAGLAAVVVEATACGGGLPLLHPARALATGEMRIAAGFAGNAAISGFADATHRATDLAASNPSLGGGGGTSNGSNNAAATAYAEGALVAASVGPGLAPFVGARVGIASDRSGGGYEGGLGYTGRVARADIRRAFGLSPRWALSVGAGGSAVLYGRQEGNALPGVDLAQMHGWGVDVPAVIGYESEGDLYLVWLGARGGGEHVELGGGASGPSGARGLAPPVVLSATRFWGGGLLGLAIGFRHLHVAMELDVSYASVSGEYNATHAQIRGVTVAPASAVWWRF